MELKKALAILCKLWGKDIEIAKNYEIILSREKRDELIISSIYDLIRTRKHFPCIAEILEPIEKGHKLEKDKKWVEFKRCCFDTYTKPPDWVGEIRNLLGRGRIHNSTGTELDNWVKKDFFELLDKLDNNDKIKQIETKSVKLLKYPSS